MKLNGAQIKSITVSGKNVYNNSPVHAELTEKGELIIHTTIGKETLQPLVITFIGNDDNKIITNEDTRSD